MLLSMTGHGQASVQIDDVRVVVELRAVNNRFLKTSINCDLDAAHQAKLEAIVKQHVHRGSINLRINSQILGEESNYQLNADVIRAYWLQLSEIAGSNHPINVESLLKLPGVVADNVRDDQNEQVWPAVEQATIEALVQLNKMRELEGSVMQQDMVSNCEIISTNLESIKSLAPGVITHYSKRMTERINSLLDPHNTSIDATDIVKEVGVFAEKCDISEETVRLGCHIEQFNKLIQEDCSNCKTLDFLVQEMLRETNTIGSKANDVEIANHVVEIKTCIERIREMVQNVE